MTDTDEFPNCIKTKTDFLPLVEKLDDEQRLFGLFAEVERISRQTKDELDAEPIPEFDVQFLGLVRLVWEAHNEQKNREPEFLARVQ